jgi:small basic protein
MEKKQQLLSVKHVRSFATYLIPFSLAGVLLALWDSESNLTILLASSFCFFVYYYLLHTYFESTPEEKLKNSRAYSTIKLIILFLGIIPPMLLIMKLDTLPDAIMPYNTIIFLLITYICIQRPKLNRNSVLKFGIFLGIAFLFAIVLAISISWIPFDLGKFTRLGAISVTFGCFLIGMILTNIVINVINKIQPLSKRINSTFSKKNE